jgi:Ca2+-binding RTX toxin-like protein
MIAAIYLSASFVAEATAAPKCDFVRQRALEATIVGTAGDDVIRGTERNDVIAARGWNDTIWGSSGHDRGWLDLDGGRR